MSAYHQDLSTATDTLSPAKIKQENEIIDNECTKEIEYYLCEPKREELDVKDEPPSDVETKSSHQARMLINSDDKQMKPFACNLCNHKANRKSNLRMHMLTHAGKTYFACNLCNYNTTKKNYLQAHRLTHITAKPFACKLCNYKGADKYLLQSHMVTHIVEKLFSCDLCKYKTNHKSNLRRHVLTHSKEKAMDF